MQQYQQQHYKKVLLLATKNALEDGFFATKLEQSNIAVIIPNQEEREGIHKIHDELKRDIITEKSKKFFTDLIILHHNLDAVILGCTELPLFIDQQNSLLLIIDPVLLQKGAAVDGALSDL